MRYHAFLIKYAEIGIKGKNRYLFEEKLCDQIKLALKRCEGKFRVARTSGRVFVYCDEEYDYDEVVESLQLVFGIVGICPVRIMDVVPPAELKSAAAAFFGEEYKDRHLSFKIHTRRLVKNYPIDSMECNAELARGYAVCGNPRENLYVLAHHSGTGRASDRKQRKGDAALIRRH